MSRVSTQGAELAVRVGRGSRTAPGRADLPTQRIENPGQNHKFPWILLPFPAHYSFQYYNNNFFSFQKFIRDAYSILILSHGEYKT